DGVTCFRCHRSSSAPRDCFLENFARILALYLDHAQAPPVSSEKEGDVCGRLESVASTRASICIWADGTGTGQAGSGDWNIGHSDRCEADYWSNSDYYRDGRQIGAGQGSPHCSSQISSGFSRVCWPCALHNERAWMGEGCSRYCTLVSGERARIRGFDDMAGANG